MSRADLAAGILLGGSAGSDLDDVTSRAAGALEAALGPSAVWQPGHLPPDLRGDRAFGVELPRWRSSSTMSPPERAALASAWRDALPDLVRRWRPNFLRVRVDTPKDVRHLRGLKRVDGLVVVPSLESRGRSRSLEWRWPFRVGVAPGPMANAWLTALRDTEHLGIVFDAEPCDPARDYDIVFVAAAELPHLSADTMSALTDAACVITVGNDRAEMLLADLESRLAPPIAITFSASPDVWWDFHTLTETCPSTLPSSTPSSSMGWTRWSPAQTGARHHRLRALVRRRGSREPRACGGPGRVPLLRLGLRECRID